MQDLKTENKHQPHISPTLSKGWYFMKKAKKMNVISYAFYNFVLGVKYAIYIFRVNESKLNDVILSLCMVGWLGKLK